MAARHSAENANWQGTTVRRVRRGPPNNITMLRMLSAGAKWELRAREAKW